MTPRLIRLSKDKRDVFIDASRVIGVFPSTSGDGSEIYLDGLPDDVTVIVDQSPQHVYQLIIIALR